MSTQAAGKVPHGNGSGNVVPIHTRIEALEQADGQLHEGLGVLLREVSGLHRRMDRLEPAVSGIASSVQAVGTRVDGLFELVRDSMDELLRHRHALANSDLLADDDGLDDNTEVQTAPVLVKRLRKQQRDGLILKVALAVVTALGSALTTYLATH